MKRFTAIIGAVSVFAVVLFAMAYMDIELNANVSRVMGTMFIASFILDRYYKFRSKRQLSEVKN